jgi:hypothetical protein
VLHDSRAPSASCAGGVFVSDLVAAPTLLDRGADLSVASELAGHASPTTTQCYDRRGERARHEAAVTVVVPYVNRRPGG